MPAAERKEQKTKRNRNQMKLITKLRRIKIYGDMSMDSNGEGSAPLVATIIEGKLLGLFWVYVKTIAH